MDGKQQKLFREIRELKSLLADLVAKEPSGCLPSIVPVAATIATFVLSILVLKNWVTPSLMVLTVITLTWMAYFISLERINKPVVRTKLLLQTRAQELGYQIKTSPSGRRFVSPESDEMKAVVLQCSPLRDSKQIICRSCGFFIEPCDLMRQCGSCSLWFHDECLKETNECRLCLEHTTVPENLENFYKEKEFESPSYAEFISASGIYPLFAIALEVGDPVEMDGIVDDYCDYRCM